MAFQRRFRMDSGLRKRYQEIILMKKVLRICTSSKWLATTRFSSIGHRQAREMFMRVLLEGLEALASGHI